MFKRLAVLIVCLVLVCPSAAFAVPLSLVDQPSTVSVAADGDSDISGALNIDSPDSGSLDATTDTDDVYKIDLDEGDIMTVWLEAPSGTYFDILLYGPDATSLLDDTVGGWWTTAYPAMFVYEVPEGEAGYYYIDLYARQGAGDYELRTYATTPGGGVTNLLFQGDDRISTALSVAINMFNECDTVVVATGYDWPDALSASALAGVTSAPLLLTRQAYLPDNVLDKIIDFDPDKVYIIGGEAAVGPAVQETLEGVVGEGNVERLWGRTRYDTSYAVAEEVIECCEASGYRPSWAFVTTGGNYPDALAVGPLAVSTSCPILLEDPRAGLSTKLAGFITDEEFEDITVIGGEAAVDSTAFDQIDALPGVGYVDRWYGANRYETAAVISLISIEYFGHVPQRIGLASGENFPDALAGSVRQGRYMSILLTTKKNSLSDPAAGIAYEYRDRVKHTSIYGGEAALARDTWKLMNDILELP